MRRPAKSSFVPATGVHWLLPLYDPLVAFCTREGKSKQWLLNQIEFESEQQILDFGCGSGTLLSAMADCAKSLGYDGLRFVGVDADERILRQAESKLGHVNDGSSTSVELLCHHGPRLPYASDQFDACVCSLVFHHLTAEEKKGTLGEFRRILRPGSSLYLMDYGRPSHVLAATCFIVVRSLDGWRQTADNATGQLPSLLEKAGFQDVQELFHMQTILGTLYAWRAIA